MRCAAELCGVRHACVASAGAYSGAGRDSGAGGFTRARASLRVRDRSELSALGRADALVRGVVGLDGGGFVLRAIGFLDHGNPSGRQGIGALFPELLCPAGAADLPVVLRRFAVDVLGAPAAWLGRAGPAPRAGVGVAVWRELVWAGARELEGPELVRRAEFFPVCVRAFLVSGYRGTVLLDLATAGVAVFETRAGSSVCLCAWIGVGVPGGAGVGRL